MYKFNRDAGFGAVGVIAIVFVVLVAGVAVYVVYNNQQNRNQNNNAATNQSNNENQELEETTKEQTQTKPQTLVISEWDLQIPLSDSISDAYYVASTSSSTTEGKPNTLFIGLKSLDSVGCEAANGNKGGKPLGLIFRAKPTETDPVSGDLLTKKYPQGKTIGGYYYGFSTWSRDNTCTTAANFQSFDAVFGMAIKNSSAISSN